MDNQSDSTRTERVELTVDIVAAYVSNNSIPAADIPGLIVSLYSAMGALIAPVGPETRATEKVSAAQIRKSITPDHLVSFEDGKPYKTLRRHLTLRGLTPEAYREKWGLPRDYPMTAASYSAQRSELARALGLGQQRRKEKAAVEDTPITVPAAKPRARKKATSPT